MIITTRSSKALFSSALKAVAARGKLICRPGGCGECVSFQVPPKVVFKDIRLLTSKSMATFDVAKAETSQFSVSTSDKRDETLRMEIPRRVRHKVLSADDAVSLIRDGDTIGVSGFVAQGAPEAILKALGERYGKTGCPNNLTLLFGGGPGDWESRGLNHLARLSPDDETHNVPPMLRRTIGGHYGQVPMVAEMALKEQIEAWTLPMGSISRMLRAQATHSPGHITDVGVGTYVDPSISGGAANESAAKSPLHNKLITKLEIEGHEHLVYKALPLNVAIIRGTTADAQGNMSCEQESLLCDQMVTAAAARNSGGIVIAQVKQLAATGSIPSRDVAVPGPLVDCVVVVDPHDHVDLHPMSYVETHNPVFTGEIKTPQDEIAKMPHDIRKLIARRSFFFLKPNTVVNLGIGLPEGVAAVAAEEGMLDFVTLSTEPGVFGGIPASGHSFGPASNASSVVQMNQMFDFYDGGGLNMCFLGAAQIGKNGDVNVSRMSKDRLTGPGGFIDISQSTSNIVFLSPLTTKGLELDIPGDGSISIKKEGNVKKFVSEVFEKTFSGDEAVKRGQSVYYVTERAVFHRSPKHDVLELIEIAPGINLKRDVLDQIDFEPVISENLKPMDVRIFKEAKMKGAIQLFGSLEDRGKYHEKDHTMFLDLFGITINTEEDIEWFVKGLRALLDPLMNKGKIDMVINYDGFDLRKGLEEPFLVEVKKIQKTYYNTVTRYTGAAFKRAQLGKEMKMSEWDAGELFAKFDRNGNGAISVEEFRMGMEEMFHCNLNKTQTHKLVEVSGPEGIDKEGFEKAIFEVLKMEG